jgi:hypothetical protein
MYSFSVSMVRKRISEAQRWQIIGMHTPGISFKAIGRQMGYHYSRFATTRVIVLESSYLFLTEVHFRLHNCKRHKTFKKLKKTMHSYSNKIRFIGIILFSFLYRPISVDSMRSVFLFHILNDRNN